MGNQNIIVGIITEEKVKDLFGEKFDEKDYAIVTYSDGKRKGPVVGVPYSVSHTHLVIGPCFGVEGGHKARDHEIKRSFIPLEDMTGLERRSLEKA